MKNPKGSESALTNKKSPTLVEVRCGHDGCEETTVMPFSRAAKGTHRCPKHSPEPATPATSAPPEVRLDNGTVAVLPNPADAPAPPKPAGRKKKPAPTVAAKTPVPDWAKRAAGRNTAAEMATVPEAAPSVEPPAPKKGRATKAKVKPDTKEMPAATPGSLRAIGAAWIETLRDAGHSVSTISSYTNDLELAFEFLGGDTAAAEISEKQIASYNASKGVVKKRNGKPRAMPTILKTRRVLRLALTWAEQKKLITKAPYAAKTPA